MNISIAHIRNGNQNTFRRFVDYYSDDLFYFALGFVKRKELAEEIVSDVFCDVWQNRTTYSGIENTKSWLLIMVRNKSISYLRKNKGYESISFDEIEDFYFPPVESPDSALIEKEMLDRINQSIEKLPPKCKMVFTLAKIQGMRYKEIAEILNISVKTINVHIASAISFLSEDTGLSKKYSSEKTKQLLLLLLLSV